jgi:predicted  nucleic acid-binding Zn-ribbon protein
MPYSKLYNIKSTKLSLQININRILNFRFITLDNLQGIKFKNTFNNYIETQNLYNTYTSTNWYKYDNDIDFSILNNYKYLVLQIYAFDKDDLVGIEQNNTFTITNENDWYPCSDNDDTCGLNLYNQIIDQNKPIQEIDESLKYTINGSAKIIKTKYLKSGEEDSNILINGFEDNVINYISEFKLNKIKVTTKINKKPTSITNYVDLDKLAPKAELTYDEDYNSVNNKLEMIKLQLKNYFIENNSEIDKLDILVNNQESNVEINKLNIESINHTLKDYNITFQQYNTQLQNINTDMKKLDLSGSYINNNAIEVKMNTIENINTVHQTDLSDINLKLDSFQKKLDNLSNQSSISDINLKLESFQKKLDIVTNQSSISDINLKLENFQKTIDGLSNLPNITEINLMLGNFQKTIDGLTNQQSINNLKLENFQKTIDNLNTPSDITDINLKLENFQKTINNITDKQYIYANDTPYIISYHNTNWTINFVTENNTYKIEKFYIVKDEFKSVSIPYYCWLIKDLNNGYSTARLFPLIPINNIYF